jgi:hypothetical protein
MKHKNENKYLGAESMEDLSEGGSSRSSKADSEPKTPEPEAATPPQVPKKMGAAAKTVSKGNQSRQEIVNSEQKSTPLLSLS